MRFICYAPQLIGKGQWGIWRVTVIYQDGRTHSADYEAFTRSEALRKHLVEFGKVRGEIQISFIKPLDKPIKVCYNVGTTKERN